MIRARASRPDARASRIGPWLWLTTATLVGLSGCSADETQTTFSSTSSGGAGGTAAGGSGGVAGTGGTAGAGGQGGSGGDGGAMQPCTLTDSPPIQVTADGQIVEELRITSTNGAAITIEGHDNVIIRNVEILHSGGQGIVISGAGNALVQDVSIENTGAPSTGQNPSEAHVNIYCYQSTGFTAERVRLTRGSAGIYLQECGQSNMSFIEGHDFRGPFPRGQVVQWNNSDDGLLEDFSVENPPESWPEDNVNAYQSLNVTIRRGLVDGNNSPSGVGVIFDGDNSTGLVEDVDAIRMGNGCFSNYAGADGNVFRRTRCRENICTDQGRGVPLSGALMWAGLPSGTQTRIEESAYYDACNPSNIYWPASSFAVVELAEVDFTLREPIRLTFCWE
ncbi:MAG: right-handed parallel beta-helix repeat-containing protein [Deltaproteobacteria bacterium]|nr:right-handed parallel beta-helix repeat-containing protein [Deltaproteobacteria bacterium]